MCGPFYSLPFQSNERKNTFQRGWGPANQKISSIHFPLIRGILFSVNCSLRNLERSALILICGLRSRGGCFHPAHQRPLHQGSLGARLVPGKVLQIKIHDWSLPLPRLTMLEWEGTTPSLTSTVLASRASGMVLVSRASRCLFGHPNPQKAPLRTPKSFWEEFRQMSISSI